ncbi:MAG: zinc ribbon domain-containing protein [Lachnospiraceae bacterium]|nr:zinc ribbon domain-containing protein [Lachnospiraceae bacterium]
MPEIIVGFGTLNPVRFKEKGCDTEFSARIAGSFYIEDYPVEAFGQTDEERKAGLKRFGEQAITEILGKWDEFGIALASEGSAKLESLLNEALKANGISGRAEVRNIILADEVSELYQKQITEPLIEARKQKRTEELEQKLQSVEELHGVLREFCYNTSTHGMMAGSGSVYHRKIEWKDDGMVVYTSDRGNGDKSVYRISPETAKKVSDFVSEQKLAALAKLDIKTAQVFDHFTSAVIVMTFDDSSIGGDAEHMICLDCGASGMTFEKIEKTVQELLEECKKTGELISSDISREMAERIGILPGFMGNAMMGMGMYMAAASENEKWICSCGRENFSKFCTDCGSPKPDGWMCACGTFNKGNFCTECGKRK